jgi:hypothetical protein
MLRDYLAGAYPKSASPFFGPEPLPSTQNLQIDNQKMITVTRMRLIASKVR